MNFSYLPIFAFSSVISLSPITAAADIFGDVWGVVTDPLKIRSSSREISSVVDRSIVSLELMQDEFDSDVRDYISELQKVIRMVDRAGAENILRAKNAVLEVERQVYGDAQKLLQEVECAAERFSKGTLPETLELIIQQLADSEIEVTLPFGQTAEASIEAAKATSPDSAYIETRDSYLEVLEMVDDQTSAYEIISVYQNIAELAFKTHCHYAKSGGGELFLREFATYSAELRPWLSVVSIKVQ